MRSKIRKGWGAVAVETARLEERVLLTAQVLSTQGSSTTTGGNGNSYLQGMSEDGRYAIYITNATNVNSSVTDSNSAADLYLYDRVTGTETLVSHTSSSSTTTANGGVTAAFISGDGNYVAYETSSTNVVTGQSNQQSVIYNVFLYSRQAGTTVLVSGSNGSATNSGNGNSQFNDLKNPLSVDGKYLFYETFATDVNSSVTDQNSSKDLYRYNRVTGTSELVSHSASSLTDTDSSNGAAPETAVSDDGTKAIFVRGSSSVVAWNGIDSSQRILTNVGDPYGLGISGDGRWLAYTVTGTTANGIYLTSFDGISTRRLSTTYDSASISMSYDGRFVSFLSRGGVDIPGVNYLYDVSGYHVFLHDRLAGANGTTVVVSHQYNDELTAIGGISDSVISPSGRYVYFNSTHQDLVGESVPGYYNVYRYDRLTRTNALMSVAYGTTSAANHASEVRAYGKSTRTDLSGDYFGFSSSSSNLTSPGDLNTSYADAIITTGGIGDKIGRWSNGRFFLDVNDNYDVDLWRDRSFGFGAVTDVPVIGNWDNTDQLQTTEVGVFRNGTWYLDKNGNATWDGTGGGDLQPSFGTTGDIPIVGDWNGDGDDEIGIFSSGTWKLDLNSNFAWDGSGSGDTQASFGISGDIPIVGDWNGDGVDDIGVVRNGNWYLDLNGNHAWDSGVDGFYSFGNSTGDIPVVGDWDRDGKDDIGVFRSGTWYFDLNGNRAWNTGVDYSFVFGNGSDLPLLGNWKDTKIGQVVATSGLVDDIGKWNNAVFYRDSDFNHTAGTTGDTANGFGNSTDLPVIGDWDGDGYDDIGAFRDSTSQSWYLDYNGNLAYNASPNGDLLKTFGTAGDLPIVGDWNGGGKDEIGTFRISNGNGVWSLDTNGNYQWDQTTGGDSQITFGVTGDTPVIGDWDGDGKDNIGIFRISNNQGLWYLDFNGNRTWDGTTGGDVYAVFGTTGDLPVVGDWNGDGRDDIGTFNSGSWSVDLNGNYAWNGTGSGDAQYSYGSSGDKPLVGNWRASGGSPSLLPQSGVLLSASETISPAKVLSLDGSQLAVESKSNGKHSGQDAPALSASQFSTPSEKKLSPRRGQGSAEGQGDVSLYDSLFSDWSFAV